MSKNNDAAASTVKQYTKEEDEEEKKLHAIAFLFARPIPHVFCSQMYMYTAYK